MTTEQLPSGKVCFELCGPTDGPVVVLVHGLAGHLGIWDKNVTALCDAGFRVLRFDLFGRGQSERVGQRHDSKLYIQQLNELLGHINIKEPVHLAGLSMGGAVVTCFAAAFPTRVASICLVASYGPVKTDAFFIHMVRPPFVGEALMGTLGRVALRIAPRRAFRDPQPPRGFGKWFTAPLAISHSKRSILSSMRHFLSEDHSQPFATVNGLAIRKSVVWGQYDRILPLSYGHKVKAMLPTAQWMVFEQSGHLPNYEEPERFNALLLKHLKG